MLMWGVFQVITFMALPQKNFTGFRSGFRGSPDDFWSKMSQFHLMPFWGPVGVIGGSPSILNHVIIGKRLVFGLRPDLVFK